MPTAPRRICVSICEKEVGALLTSIQSASEFADIVEIRLDYFSHQQLPLAVAELRKNSSVATILTLRPHVQGGRDIDIDYRLQFWRELGFSSPAAFFDMEIDLAERFIADGDTTVDWSRVICSAHDFHNGVSVLDSLYERLTRIPARILKIAVVPDDAVENLDIFRLLSRAHAEGRELIALGMGTAGIASRILGISRGSTLTYAAYDRPTASGQPNIIELRDQYRINQISKATRIAGLIGDPVSHSLSPQIHNAAFKALAVDGVYLPFESGDLPSFMRRMVHPASREIEWNFRGLSVTTPHKQTVMDHLDLIDSAAKEIGAVNTVVIEGEKLKGYNTDAYGFISALKTRLPDVTGKQCAVIGSGGAARAAVWSLLQEGAKVSVFVRDTKRAQPLADSFEVPLIELKPALFNGFDVVVNTTVVGMSGELEQQTPATVEQLRGARLAYDLVYNPTETRFLRDAKTAGCETLGGLPMFVAQAAEQFRLWTGKDAPFDVMHNAAIEALSR